MSELRRMCGFLPEPAGIRLTILCLAIQRPPREEPKKASVSQSPNKQLQRTVIRRRVCGASASFHCAHAPRWTVQRAAAELRR
jgi:hypothetical protein